MTFDLLSIRFHLQARDLIRFPPGLPGNILRGALGSALRAGSSYARIFEPSSISSGPSGLADWPRPFVIRARRLSGCVFEPGQTFWFDVHLFDALDPPVEPFRQAFAAMAAEGLGPARGKAELVSLEQSPISIALDPGPRAAARIRVEFCTPTELKSGEQVVVRPEFAVLLARARDRVSSLRALYGAGPLEIDFRELGARSRAVELVHCDLQPVELVRRSSRTGQRHGIGGFVGVVEYQGDLGEFLPFLDAAHFTGVGRHCVWGNGEIVTGVLA